MSAIVFDNVGRRFERNGQSFPALEEVSLTVADKEFVALVGPSGCGKTTCLRMAAGFEMPSSGRVLVGGVPVHGPGPDRAVVFQQFALFPWKNVTDNIAFGLRNKGMLAAERQDRVASIIKLMGLEGYETAFPHQLSGGMQQRVAIARAYVLEPEVLLMDEPFGALDAQTREIMAEELLKIWDQRRTTVVFVTHGIDESIYLADRVVVMGARPGRILETIEIDLPRPRTPEVRATPEFQAYRARISALLFGQTIDERRVQDLS